MVHLRTSRLGASQRPSTSSQQRLIPTINKTFGKSHNPRFLAHIFQTGGGSSLCDKIPILYYIIFHFHEPYLRVSIKVRICEDYINSGGLDFFIQQPSLMLTFYGLASLSITPYPYVRDKPAGVMSSHHSIACRALIRLPYMPNPQLSQKAVLYNCQAVTTYYFTTRSRMKICLQN